MFYRSFFILLTLLSQILTAEIQDHFKPCKNKSKRHKMEKIDFIYMINLDERPEKFKQSEQQFLPFKIYPYRFSAVNGWQIPLEALSDLGITIDQSMNQNMMGTRYPVEMTGSPHHEKMKVNENYFCHCMSRGAIGIVLSHLSILQDAYDSGYKTIWVMEDDIEIIQNPHILSDRIKQLDKLVGKNNWDILFTDPDTKNKNGDYIQCLSYAPRPNFTPDNQERFSSRVTIHPYFKKIGARYGAYSMIIRRSGIKKILKFIKQYRIFLPYDMDYYLPNDIKIYSLTEDIVSTLPQALTDNGSPNYLLKKE